MRASLNSASLLLPRTATTRSFKTHPANAECDVVRVTKAVGDELRANILRVLATDSFGVQELCSIFSSAQPALSHHLKILREVDLVSQRKEGTNVFYRRSSYGPATLQSALFDAIDSHPPAPEHARQIDQLNQQRAQRSEAFFASNKDVLDQQDELICPTEVYLPCVMSSLPSQPKAQQRAMEVGPGSGALLLQLAERYDHVVGLDNSSTMLSTTAETIADQPTRTQIELVQQDFFTLADSPRYDALVAAMVLHHMPSPEAFFEKASRLIAKHGHLVVAELCSHTQAWVTDSVGDLWLGFEPSMLERWALQHGFQTTEQQHLAQRNGFRVQVLSFQRNE
jgi:2-polyprenyl-3-methyl-5-hydroxy-6-metoxy-1,4-benzoquinol methylase